MQRWCCANRGLTPVAERASLPRCDCKVRRDRNWRRAQWVDGGHPPGAAWPARAVARKGTLPALSHRRVAVAVLDAAVRAAGRDAGAARSRLLAEIRGRIRDRRCEP